MGKIVQNGAYNALDRLKGREDNEVSIVYTEQELLDGQIQCVNDSRARALFWSILFSQRRASVAVYVRLFAGIETGPTVYKKVVIINFLVVLSNFNTQALKLYII